MAGKARMVTVALNWIVVMSRNGGIAEKQSGENAREEEAKCERETKGSHPKVMKTN